MSLLTPTTSCSTGVGAPRISPTNRYVSANSPKAIAGTEGNRLMTTRYPSRPAPLARSGSLHLEGGGLGWGWGGQRACSISTARAPTASDTLSLEGKGLG